MKILILGGTIFLGRYLAESALDRGHEVTLFNRGEHNPDLFPEIEKIRGDRKNGREGLRGLDGGSWDAVIDTCGYVPRIVRESAEYLADKTTHYTFISTVSVYADMKTTGIDEDYPVGVLEKDTEEVDGETYGPLKALCETAALDAMPGRTLVIRPGLIVGPHDPTYRFTYWPVRIARGGDVLVPKPDDMLHQVIDVRDLAEWNIRMVEQKKIGTYNATGLATPFTTRELVETCKEISESDANFTWVDPEFLLEQEVGQWMELPLWIAPDPDMIGFSQTSIRKAVDDGLTFRSLVTTIRDTLAWESTEPEGDRPAGLKSERETELLRLWTEARES